MFSVYILKAFLTAVLISSIVVTGYCQERAAYVWPMGYPNSGEPHPDFGGVLLDFNENTCSIRRFDLSCWMASHSMLCDSDGQISLYTNGCSLYDQNGNIIPHGDSLSYTLRWWLCPDNYISNNGPLILTFPGDMETAVMMHIRMYDDLDGGDILFTNLLHTSGSWTVTNKNTILFSSDRVMDYLSAVRHANGRDWWVIAVEGHTNRYITCLLTPDGVPEIFAQEAGKALIHPFGGGQSTFSPDGRKYIRFMPRHGLDIFDFDRCTGLLSNPIHSNVFIDWAGGVAVSADSRFLYVPNVQHLYQFDLTATHIISSRELVGTYDGYLDPFPTTFFQAALAPDGKIYISATNGVRSLHVIHHPERKGKACDFRQHDLHCPVYLVTVPNFANYRIGPLDGSPCDTLGINNIPVAEFRYAYDPSDERSVFFRNTSAFDPTDFLWDFGDGHTSRDEHPGYHLYYRSGTYSVCLTAWNQYGSDTFCRDVPVTLHQEYETPTLPDFILAPNPVRDYVRISFGSLHNTLQFDLYDTAGRHVYTTTLPQDRFDHFLSLEHLPPGLYVYCISGDRGQRWTGKVVKM